MRHWLRRRKDRLKLVKQFARLRLVEQERLVVLADLNHVAQMHFNHN